MVQLLLENGASINKQSLLVSNDGLSNFTMADKTALHFACSNRHRDVVKLLLENEADPSIFDSKHKLPEELALLSDHPETALIVICSKLKKKRSKKAELSKMKLTHPIMGPIASLHSITSLILKDNRIQKIPMREILQLPLLTELNLKRNLIDEIPLLISALKNLALLNLSFNCLDSPPLALSGALPSTTKIKLVGNPFKQVPKNIVKGGTADLMLYLAQLQKEKVSWNRIKLLVVGEENVGKTSLLQYLQFQKPHNGLNLSTNGIEIKSLHSIDDKVLFSAWDFGGQEVFYPTHQVSISRLL